MDLWFAKFLDGSLEHRTDKPDRLPQSASVSGKSAPFPKSTGENLSTPQQARTPPCGIRPGDRVTWQRNDLSWQTALVDFLHVDAAGDEWLFCTLRNGEQNTLNPKIARLCNESERR